MKTKKLIAMLAAAVAIVTVNPAFAAEHVINAEARVFNPDIVYMAPGDSVRYTNMTSHNSASIEGVIPEGATPWVGKLGEALQITLDKEGVYGYVCQPHIGFGMMGLIVVGKPTNLEAATKYVEEKYTGTPFARILGKLKKVKAE